MKVGLVLGGGGFVGGAWLTGALEALEQRTGMLPTRFDHVVGTSAGAMIGAVTASGVHPAKVPDLFAGTAAGGSAERAATASLRLEGGFPRIVPGSVRLAINAVRHPRRHRLGVAMAAMMPRGFLSTEPLKEMVRAAVPHGWSKHKGLWVTAACLGCGKRVSFGRADAPKADLAEAVAASCAIPGFYAPVRIGEADYADGGCYSVSNLDVLRNAGLDLVVCFNPASSVERTGPVRIRERIGEAYRSVARAQLEREASILRGVGTEVLLVQPLEDDLVAMGVNLMARTGLETVTEVARRTVMEQLASGSAAPFMDALSSLSRPASRRPGAKSPRIAKSRPRPTRAPVAERMVPLVA